MRSGRILFSFVLILFASAALLGKGEPRQLTPSGQYFMQPVWSPDGSRLALAGRKYSGLWIINHDGSGLRQVSGEIGAGFAPKWSRDGQHLATRVSKYEGKKRWNALKVFDVNTGRGRALTEYRTLMTGLPQWSGGGTRVVMYGDRGLEQFNTGLSPAPSIQSVPLPVCFTSAEGIRLGNVEDGLRLMSPAPGRIINAVLSPDGERVAVEVSGARLYAVTADGSVIHDLGRGERPHWSPDGLRLTYMITEDDGHQFLASDIYTIRWDGADKRALTETPDRFEMNPNWSPDGRYVAFDTRGEGVVYVVEVE